MLNVGRATDRFASKLRSGEASARISSFMRHALQYKSALEGRSIRIPC